MAYDSLGRYSATHKPWDHVGNALPDIEHSEGIRPAGEFKPAAWLPVQFYDKYYEVYYTVMPGKIVAADNDGRLVPGQYGLAGATVTYTATDVTAGVIDIRTGVTLLAAAVGSFNLGTVSGFMGRTSVVAAVGKPLGVAPYGYFQWAGDASSVDDGSTPAGFRDHNHNLQHRVAILCDYVIELPVVPVVATAETVGDGGAGYQSVSSGVQTLSALSALPVAKNTVRTPITFANSTATDAATIFVNEVDTTAELLAAGDWHIEETTGVISFYTATDLSTHNTTAYAVTYYNYASAPATVSDFACAVGNLAAGDFLICDTNSNFVEATTEDFKDVMGQVLEVEDVKDKSALGKVRTAYDSLSTSATGSLPAYAGQMDQMPGSANGGVPDKVHYAGAANLVARINLVSR